MTSSPPLASPADDAPSADQHYPPFTHLLSKGSYAVMLTASGSGSSRWNALSVTRWREDPTRDNWGSYIFLRDKNSGETWSAGLQPSGVRPDQYATHFTEGAGSICRHDGTLETVTDICIARDHPAELRCVSVTNHGSITRIIELTSYAELVLSPHNDDDAHQAFSKMFIETEWIDEHGILLATRRRRKAEDAPVWAAHFMVVDGMPEGPVEFESDRDKFIGRDHELRTALAMRGEQPLHNSRGTVLDPIFSLRRTVAIPPGATARIGYWTAVGSSKDELIATAQTLSSLKAVDQALSQAKNTNIEDLSNQGLDATEAALFQRLANHLIFVNAALRPGSAALRQGHGSAPLLWAHGISGDIPILFIDVKQPTDIERVRQLIRAHVFMGTKLFAVDFVIINCMRDDNGSLHAEIEKAIKDAGEPKADKLTRGSIFILHHDAVDPATQLFMKTTARVVLRSDLALASQLLDNVPQRHDGILTKRARHVRDVTTRGHNAQPALEFFNGYGGFADGGRSYVTVLDDGASTPAPWINVIANPNFGFHASMSGSGYTWSVNSQQHHLTPWSNDPVADAAGEAIYINDDETGFLLTPTALPIRHQRATYTARHGQGFSRFEVSLDGLTLELLQYVPIDDPIKISRLTIINHLDRARHLSVTGYVDWILGASKAVTRPSLLTEIDTTTNALFAQNLTSPDFPGRVAFFDMSGQQTSWTGDRTEFLGTTGSLSEPACLVTKQALSNRTGAALDACGALQRHVDLDPNESVHLTFFLGDTESDADSRALVKKYRKADLDEVLQEATGYWDTMLNTVQIETPDPTMDCMVNCWLPYQILSCRVWARSGFYQASGAYGFRDQIQDVMALSAIKPVETRNHLLRAAARQFVEGDVQHWWLPESGRGIRTRISDDRIWLAYAVAHYIDVSGDMAILDEVVPYLDGPVLKEDENEAFFEPKISSKTGTLYEHCALALDVSLKLGSHGLPLIGTGDWNDGMNHIGPKGKGESVWLAWFLHRTLTDFVVLATRRRDQAHVTAWREHQTKLSKAVDAESWDGAWYRRAYFDDGHVLGSTSNDECQIDVIAQSWSVISGAGDKARGAKAMASVSNKLIDRDAKIALLFTPPFDHTSLDPGYIKGYPPGLRENGGQYTHGAIWSILAFALLGQGDQAHDLFKMINPLSHSSTFEEINRYKVEPYTVCADLYSVDPHRGRGGWTWYTGSAGWMYRAGLEYILGFKLRGETLHMDPCIPKKWPGAKLTFRYHGSIYDIHIENPSAVNRGVKRMELDGKGIDVAAGIALQKDGATHRLRVVLG